MEFQFIKEFNILFPSVLGCIDTFVGRFKQPREMIFDKSETVKSFPLVLSVLENKVGVVFRYLGLVDMS